jgi:predicted metal-binding membrane protein
MTAITQSERQIALVPHRASDQIFLRTAGLLFIASSALAVVWCRSMAAMGSMPMPGGWNMSMTWMRMLGQTWFEAATSFFGMWVAMMTAMMLPSATSMLIQYRRSLEQSAHRNLNTLTSVIAAAYFAVWILSGAPIYGLGTVLAAVEMQHPMLSRSVPSLAALCVLIAGALQFTRWKAHHLACCRLAPSPQTIATDLPTAWRQGLSLGFHCILCCLNLTAILLVLGIMDIRAMVIVTAAITVERLAPAGAMVTRIIGASAVCFGTTLLLRAMDVF